MKLVLKWDSEIRLFNSKLNYHDLRAFIQSEFGLEGREFEMTYDDQEGDKITIATEEDMNNLKTYFEGRQYVKVFIKAQKRELTSSIDHENDQALKPMQEVPKKKKKKNVQKSKMSEEIPKQNGSEGAKKDKIKKVNKEKGKKDNTIDEIKKTLNLAVVELVDERIKAMIPCMREMISHKRQEPQVELVHQGHECSLCFVNPIIGFRYQCPICQKFTICETCQKYCQHEHNLLKIRHLSQQIISTGSNHIDKICNILLEKSLQVHKKNVKLQKQKKQEQIKSQAQKQKIQLTKRFLSRLFEKEPKEFHDFVKKNKKATLEEIVKLYALEIKLSQNDLKKKVIDLQTHLLAKKFGKQASFYEDFVKDHFSFDFSTILKDIYEFGVEIKEKKGVKKVTVAKMPLAKVEQAPKEVRWPIKAEQDRSFIEESFIEEPLKQQKPVLMKQRVKPQKQQGTSLLRREKNETLNMMVEFFGPYRLAQYQKFIEENSKYSKQDILQRWANNQSVINP